MNRVRLLAIAGQTLEAGIRYSDYSIDAPGSPGYSTTTWKGAATWEPFDGGNHLLGGELLCSAGGTYRVEVKAYRGV